MREEPKWSIVLDAREDGSSPVREFLTRLDPKTQARFVWSIDQLRLRNVQAREPLARHVGGKLWELRRESDTNVYRILYIFLPRRRILLLHGFQKKTQTTPRREIEIAENRIIDFLEREEVRGSR